MADGDRLQTVLVLTSDPGGKWEPRRLTLMAEVVLDERHDLAWAECAPELRIEGGSYGLLLLQPRFRGTSLWDAGDGVPVYVCTTTRGNEAADVLTRRFVRVLNWGVVTEVPAGARVPRSRR